MSDLISRQDVLKALSYQVIGDKIWVGDARCAIENIPSAQKIGHWEWVQYDANTEIGNWHCSECRFVPACYNLAKMYLKYCPNCGAKMRGDTDD